MHVQCTRTCTCTYINHATMYVICSALCLCLSGLSEDGNLSIAAHMTRLRAQLSIQARKWQANSLASYPGRTGDKKAFSPPPRGLGMRLAYSHALEDKLYTCSTLFGFQYQSSSYQTSGAESAPWSTTNPSVYSSSSCTTMATTSQEEGEDRPRQSGSSRPNSAVRVWVSMLVKKCTCTA